MWQSVNEGGGGGGQKLSKLAWCHLWMPPKLNARKSFLFTEGSLKIENKVFTKKWVPLYSWVIRLLESWEMDRKKFENCKCMRSTEIWTKDVPDHKTIEVIIIIMICLFLLTVHFYEWEKVIVGDVILYIDVET